MFSVFKGRGLNRSDEFCSLVLCWDHAGIFPAKPPVTVSCHPVVNGIPHKSWDDPEYLQRFPIPGKMFCKLKECRRFCIDLFFFNHHERRKVIPIQTMFVQQSLAGRRLKWSEAESIVPVVADEEVDRPVTKITDAIEQDYRMFHKVQFDQSKVGTPFSAFMHSIYGSICNEIFTSPFFKIIFTKKSRGLARDSIYFPDQLRL